MGSTPLSQQVRKLLKRKTPIKTRSYNLENSASNKYKDLIESFTKSDFDTYENYYKKWGRSGAPRADLVRAMETRSVEGVVLELARVRLNNVLDHQKIWQCLRYRWTNIQSYHQTKTNSIPDAVWKKLARGVISRMNEFPRMHSSEWGDNKEKMSDLLVKCFKQKFRDQNGLCALSKVPLDIAIGADIENKCSIDRIDSSKPYTYKNIQLVTFWANVMKFDVPMKVFLKRVSLIHQASQKV